MGGAAILGLANTAMQIGGQFALSHYNTENEQLLRDHDRLENYRYGEAAALQADLRTRALYNDIYSPKALLKQYGEAGLSPSLMFGGTPGQGGTSGAQGTGAAGPVTNYHPVMMPESLLAGAQAEALIAQAEKTKAETTKIEKQTEPEIIKMLAEAGASKAATAATEAQTIGIKLDNYLKEHTNDANIFTICELADKTAYEASKMYNEMRSSKVLADLDENLYTTNIEKGKKELEQLISCIKLTNQQKEYLRNEVLWSFEKSMQAWKDLDIKERNTKSYEDWIEAQIPNIEKQLEIRLKELGIEKTRLIVNSITDVIKGVGMTAIALSSFKGGKGSDQTPNVKNFTPGGKAVDPYRGLNNSKNNSIWQY